MFKAQSTTIWLAGARADGFVVRLIVLAVDRRTLDVAASRLLETHHRWHFRVTVLATGRPPAPGSRPARRMASGPVLEAQLS
jgi:hypothetical protein